MPAKSFRRPKAAAKKKPNRKQPVWPWKFSKPVPARHDNHETRRDRVAHIRGHPAYTTKKAVILSAAKDLLLTQLDSACEFHSSQTPVTINSASYKGIHGSRNNRTWATGNSRRYRRSRF